MASDGVGHISAVLRFAEVMRQKVLPDGGSTFLTTPNQRNARMLKETHVYARLIKHFVKKVKAIARATDDLLGEAEHVIESPLPREFTMKGGVLKVIGDGLELNPGEAAKAAKVAPNEDKLKTTAVRDKFKADLDERVYGPVAKWMEQHAAAKKQFKAAESVRFELDAARRRQTFLEAKLVKLGNSGKAEEAYAAMQERVSAMKGQVVHFTGQYTEQEAAVNSALHALISEATVLKEAVTEALDICSSTLSAMGAPGGFVEQSFLEASKGEAEEGEAVEPKAASAKPAASPAKPKSAYA